MTAVSPKSLISPYTFHDILKPTKFSPPANLKSVTKQTTRTYNILFQAMRHCSTMKKCICTTLIADEIFCHALTKRGGNNIDTALSECFSCFCRTEVQLEWH